MLCGYGGRRGDYPRERGRNGDDEKQSDAGIIHFEVRDMPLD